VPPAMTTEPPDGEGAAAAHTALTDPTTEPAAVVAECVAAAREAMEAVATYTHRQGI
jgi:hypothetical protein